MSAFIIDQQTMQKVIAGVERLVKDSPGYWIPKITGRSYSECFGDGRELKPDYKAIGDSFYQLNQSAVFQRYEGRHESGDPAPAYEHKRSLCSAIESIKAMACLRYQCSEGDCDETPTYALLGEIIGSLAEKIVKGLPEYDKAGWG